MLSYTSIGRVIRSSILKSSEVTRLNSFKSLAAPKRNFSKFSSFNLQCCQRKIVVRGFQSKATPLNKSFPNKSSNETFVFVKYACFSLGAVLCVYGIEGLKNYQESKNKKAVNKNISRRLETPPKFSITINNQVIDPTYVGLLMANTVVFLGWKISSLESFMTKFFTLCTVEGMRNFPSMITNAFSHRSFMHFALNMYVLKGFMHPWTSKEKNTTLPNVSKSDMFLPFYISAALSGSTLSFLVKLLTRTSIPSLGASGAIMGLLGYACAKYPDSQLSIVILPNFTFSAESGLKAICLFDMIGLASMIFRSRMSPIDHAGHLGGLFFGVWYAYGGEQVMLGWMNYVCRMFDKFTKKD